MLYSQHDEVKQFPEIKMQQRRSRLRRARPERQSSVRCPVRGGGKKYRRGADDSSAFRRNVEEKVGPESVVPAQSIIRRQF
ncbi:hypothetical protein EVAR_17450_1 [Eumeta japonica]|uniref:Uncharacterized protein n=1 Tax=Eumeta variegata TaxID=151549 RepID=A0A4C1V9M8_EUMVA|nr:hypothetical protein EVAR_17450_1 [Eumeta japonica]